MKTKQIKISNRQAVNISSAIQWFIIDDEFTKSKNDIKELRTVRNFLIGKFNLILKEGE